jgi:putative heme utilization carrier protein HutX
MRIAKPALISVMLSAAFAGHATAADPMCADTAQKQKITEHFKTSNPAIVTAVSARTLQMPEEIVASALPAEQGVGVKGTAFQQVWETLPAWGDTFFMVMKGGHVFELETKIMKGVPSAKSNFYNIEHGAPLAGHLRSDLISSIYAVTAKTRGQELRSVIFYGPTGESMFAAVVREDSPPAQKEAFEKTLALMKTLPKACS